jgi:solute carrier family 25 folate transporter 32
MGLLNLQDHAVAGLGAGTIATLVMHPLDLVKVRFQLATTSTRPTGGVPLSTGSSNSASSSSGPVSALRPPSSLLPTSSNTTIPTTNPIQPSTSALKPPTNPPFGTAVYRALADAVKTDGPSGLYRGLVPNLVGGASSWGLYFLL